MNRRTGWVVVIVALLGLAGWSLWRGTVDPVSAPRRGNGRPAVAVECAPLVRGKIREVRVFTGSLQPRARYLAAPKIGGRLLELPLRIGDTVRAGKVLASLDDEEHVQQVEQAKAALEVARATVAQQETALALARRELERVVALRERGIASEAEWDAVQADYESRETQLRLARAQENERVSALRAAEVRLSYTRIRPHETVEEGVWRVAERFVDEGAMLAANTPVLALVDIGMLTAVIHVIERDVPSLGIGLPVTLDTDAFPGETFSGSVVRIAPSLREASRQARVEIEVPNDPPRLLPGMFVRARIEFGHSTDALLAPRPALVMRDGQPGLFLLDPVENIARYIPVRIGIQTREQVEILEPEIEGEVVTLGHHLLTDGAAVLICERSARAAAPDGQPARSAP